MRVSRGLNKKDGPTVRRCRLIRCEGWLIGLLVGSASGCALTSPHQVCRIGGDYNTERALSAQMEWFDHLPPKAARVRLMKWGYNVGMPGASHVVVAGPGVMVLPPELYPAPLIEPPVIPPGTQAPLPDLLDQSQPPELPPSSLRSVPQDQRLRTPPPVPGPSATSPGDDVTRTSASTISQRPRARSTAWLFTPPQ